MKRWIDILLDFFLAVVGLAILWVFAQVFLFASFHIPSDSMEPGASRRGFCSGLETGARCTTIQPQRNIAIGASRNPQGFRIPQYRKE